MADLLSYIDIRDRHQAASDEALEASKTAQLLRDETEELAKSEQSARAKILAAERDAIAARAVLFARGEDTAEADAALADYAEALGRYSAQIERMRFADAMAAARGE